MNIVFNANGTQFTIPNFPTISGPQPGQPPISTPVGNDTYTITAVGTPSGTYNPATGQLGLNISLHLHNSVTSWLVNADADFAYTGAQMLTTETCISQDSRMRFTGGRVSPPAGGHILLVGATQVSGSGFFGSNDFGLVIDGQLTGIPSASNLQTFNSLTFTITTGSDDLRGDSSATATVMINGSPQTFTLKRQSDPGWGNNSNNVRTFAINGPAQPAAAFGPISITLTSHDSWTESPDNWNIQDVTITATGPNNASTLLKNDSGNPFRRLTNSAPTATL